MYVGCPRFEMNLGRSSEGYEVDATSDPLECGLQPDFDGDVSRQS